MIAPFVAGPEAGAIRCEHQNKEGGCAGGLLNKKIIGQLPSLPERFKTDLKGMKYNDHVAREYKPVPEIPSAKSFADDHREEQTDQSDHHSNGKPRMHRDGQ
ncbi:MAG: hypothetical protein AAGH57_05225 [Pseudomonadota bacterium]